MAKLAGVSRQTVSNVVNERGGFSDETRDKVLQVIAETGYKPNRAARQLRTNRSRHIGFPLHTGHVDPRNPFTLLFLKAVADAIKPLGHSLIVFACGDDDERRSARGPAAARSTGSSSTGWSPATTGPGCWPSWACPSP